MKNKPISKHELDPDKLREFMDRYNLDEREALTMIAQHQGTSVAPIVIQAKGTISKKDKYSQSKQ